jgi:hypothetical protein
MRCKSLLCMPMTAYLFIIALGLLPLAAATVALVLMFRHKLDDT